MKNYLIAIGILIIAGIAAAAIVSFPGIRSSRAAIITTDGKMVPSTVTDVELASLAGVANGGHQTNIGIQKFIGVLSTDGTVTNVYGQAFSAAPVVVVSYTSASAATNLYVVTSGTTSNTLAGLTNSTFSGIAIGTP